MPSEAQPRVRLIPVEVKAGEGRLLFASSPSLPSLLVTAPSEDELAREVPACIRMLLKAQHGIDVDVFAVEPDEHLTPMPYVPWAAVPSTSDGRAGSQ
jgi:hypothetical protein